MCYRFYMELSPELRPIIEAAEKSLLTEKMVNTLARPLITEGEIRPTNIVPVIAPDRSGSISVFPMVWGFHLPRSSSPLVNARVETAAVKQAFKDSWKRRRCVIPASYYFEWEHHINPATGKSKTGDKFMIQPKGSEVVWLAGLYRIEVMSGLNVPVFTILTREPEESIRFIHDRMPVMLAKDSAEEWIKVDGKPEEIVKQALTDMIFEKVG